MVHLEPRREGLDLRDRVLAIALAEPLVREAHDITIYQHDGLVSVSLHLKLAPEVSIAKAHDVAERVEAALREEPDVQDVHTVLMSSPTCRQVKLSGTHLVRRRAKA